MSPGLHLARDALVEFSQATRVLDEFARHRLGASLGHPGPMVDVESLMMEVQSHIAYPNGSPRLPSAYAPSPQDAAKFADAVKLAEFLVIRGLEQRIPPATTAARSHSRALGVPGARGTLKTSPPPSGDPTCSSCHRYPRVDGRLTCSHCYKDAITILADVDEWESFTRECTEGAKYASLSGRLEATFVRRVKEAFPEIDSWERLPSPFEDITDRIGRYAVSHLSEPDASALNRVRRLVRIAALHLSACQGDSCPAGDSVDSCAFTEESVRDLLEAVEGARNIVNRVWAHADRVRAEGWTDGWPVDYVPKYVFDDDHPWVVQLLAGRDKAGQVAMDEASPTAAAPGDEAETPVPNAESQGTTGVPFNAFSGVPFGLLRHTPVGALKDIHTLVGHTEQLRAETVALGEVAGRALRRGLKPPLTADGSPSPGVATAEGPSVLPSVVGGTITQKQIAGLLSEVAYDEKSWTENAVRKRISRDRDGLFAGLRECRLTGKRARFDSSRVRGVLRPYIEATKQEWESASLTRHEIRAAKAARERWLQVPK